MGQHRILIVEDHERLLRALQSVLQTEGYQVFTALDGVEALEVMEQVRPDLVVVDIMMPRMDGYALYEAIRSRSEWVPIPIIFLTAKAEREDVLKGKGLGAEDYITKPFETEELLVTIRARLERAEAIQKVAESEFEHLKQQIVTILGHELRTPLTYVAGYTQLGLEEAPHLSPDEFQEFLLGIKKGADRLNRLVEDMLLMVHLDTGQIDQDFQVMSAVHHNLGSVLRVGLEPFRDQAAAQGITLQIDVPVDLPPVRLCEQYFVDALRRLVGNAIKFSGAEGKQVTVLARSVDGWVEVDIVDEGVGIPQEKLSQLFKRFQQVDRDRMEQQGVGVGLAIAMELIHLHGGEITVDSEVDKGSTFTVRLPTVERLEMVPTIQPVTTT
jgi:signal transduction histidine kinase